MKKQMCMFLVFVFLLVGCGGQNDKADNDMKPDLEANLLYENTISPNEKYVENEADLVYYTVKVYQETGGLLVTSHSNSAFSKDMQYEIETDAEITKEDVSVQWQTLSGETTDSQKNQFGLAVVYLQKAQSLTKESSALSAVQWSASRMQSIPNEKKKGIYYGNRTEIFNEGTSF